MVSTHASPLGGLWAGRRDDGSSKSHCRLQAHTTRRVEAECIDIASRVGHRLVVDENGIPRPPGGRRASSSFTLALPDSGLSVACCLLPLTHGNSAFYC